MLANGQQYLGRASQQAHCSKLHRGSVSYFSREWGTMSCCSKGWGGVEWGEVGWGGMEWGGVGWGGMKWSMLYTQALLGMRPGIHVDYISQMYM